MAAGVVVGMLHADDHDAAFLFDTAVDGDDAVEHDDVYV